MAQTKTRRSKECAEEKRAERRKADRERMAAAVEALQTSEGWKRWLRVRSSFGTYSFHNQLLIAHQCPQATRVAGFRKWLELGYAVQKGEHAIRIWAPCPPSKKQIDRWRVAGADPDDKPRTYYKMVAVFDRSQVEPLPEFPGSAVDLDPPREPLGGDSVAHLLDPLADLVRSLDLDLSFGAISGPAAGFFDRAEGRIVIDTGPDRSPNSQVSTLIHETAHALVKLDRQDFEPALSYSEEEVVVEAVAFCVCSSVGFDTAPESVPYLAGWGGEETPASIERYAALIDRLARRIEGAI
jgi:antirestriction protein ArdC